MRRTALPIVFVITAALVTPPGSASGDEPEATPTPSPTPVAGERSLSDVAGSITLDRDAAGEGSGGGIVISNSNLPELAGKGAITEVTKQGTGAGQRPLADVLGSGPEVEGQGPGYAENQEKKAYWQAVYQKELDLVTSIRTQIALLDDEIPGLWRDFYAWDDPAYRDGVIKPRIDEAMAQRQKLEADLQEAEARLAEVKETARRDGAQPGWWRGFEAPPTPVPTRGVMPP